MVTKKLSLSALLLVSLMSNFTSFAVSDTAQAEAYQGKEAEWKYLEAKFIVNPSNKYNSQIQKSRAVVFALVASSILISKIPFIQDYTKFDASTLKMDLPTVSAGILGLIGFDTYANYLNASIKHDTLVNFIKNWDFHKKYVPTSLISAFDELTTAFNNSKDQAFTREQVNQIFEVIQHLLEHTFANRYKPSEEKKEGLIAVFKTITDISKNLSPKKD